jgi:arsenate reductase-like glutaredoxin family protein
MTCKRAQGFLESVGSSVSTVLDAKRIRLGPKDALELARKMSNIVAAKGKKIVTFDMKSDHPDDESLLQVLIGPSGNLRAPTAIVGSTLLVGFSEVEYRKVLLDPKSQ